MSENKKLSPVICREFKDNIIVDTITFYNMHTLKIGGCMYLIVARIVEQIDCPYLLILGKHFRDAHAEHPEAQNIHINYDNRPKRISHVRGERGRGQKKKKTTSMKNKALRAMHLDTDHCSYKDMSTK